MKIRLLLTVLAAAVAPQLIAQKQIDNYVTERFDETSMRFLKGDSVKYLWTNSQEDTKLYDWFMLPVTRLSGNFEGEKFDSYDQTISYSWSNFDSTYSKYSEIAHTLNTQGGVTKRTNRSFVSGTYFNVSEIRYQLDSNNNVTEELRLTWDNSTGWTENSRINRTIGSNGLVDSAFVYFNFQSMWYFSGLHLYFYNNGELERKEFKQFVQSDSSYLDMSSVTYLKDSVMPITYELVTDRWAQSQGEVLERHYNQVGLLDSARLFYGNPAGFLMNRVEYIYDGDDLVEVIAANYNRFQNKYFPQLKYTIDYNHDKTVEVVTEYSITPSGWAIEDNNLRRTYYYQKGVSVDELRQSIQYDIYPNPSAYEITIGLNENTVVDQIRIVDLSGKIVFESNAKLNSSNITLPVHQLSNGTYVLTIGSNGVHTSKKIVVRH